MFTISTKFRKPILIYPVVFAIFPIVNLWIQNFNLISFREFITVGTITIFCSGITWWSLYKINKSYEKSALLTAIFFILFFSFGQFLPSTANFYFRITGADISQYLLNNISWKLYLQLIIWVGLFTLFFILVRQSKKEFKIINQFMNVSSLILLLLITFRSTNELLIRQRINREMETLFETESEFIQEGLPKEQSTDSAFPNIYYIILDGYAREDILARNYSYDNDEFINSLSEKGFYIANSSSSNYPLTILSLSSSLNMEYLDNVPDEVGIDSVNPLPVLYRIRFNRLNRFLNQLGYISVAFESGYNGTDFSFVDKYQSPGLSLTTFQNELIKMTPLYIWFHRFQYYSHQQRILYIFEQLPLIVQSDEPTFIFSHIVAPHPPFVFGINGELEYQDRVFSLYDGVQLSDNAGQNEYINRYRNELIYLNTLVSDTVDKILAKTGRDSIIIIQSDHGPASMLDFRSIENTNVEERMSILNTYYFPDQDYSKLYPDITPVNTFRVILDQYFGTDLGLLEDRSYFSLMETPYDFIDVTEELSHP
jgi:hypothetical protein